MGARDGSGGDFGGEEPTANLRPNVVRRRRREVTPVGARQTTELTAPEQLALRIAAASDARSTDAHVTIEVIELPAPLAAIARRSSARVTPRITFRRTTPARGFPRLALGTDALGVAIRPEGSGAIPEPIIESRSRRVVLATPPGRAWRDLAISLGFGVVLLGCAVLAATFLL
jgi:hypothetical protein